MVKPLDKIILIQTKFITSIKIFIIHLMYFMDLLAFKLMEIDLLDFLQT